jgi:hypothetical protein
MIKYTFIDPTTLDRIERKVNQIEEAHPDAVQRWQLWQMVATIEAGKADAIRYEGDGLNMRWWSAEGSSDPSTAHSGFYRQEKGQMVGWALYLVWQQEPEDRADEFDRVMHGVYRHYDVRWEDEPHVWGYEARDDFFTPQEAADVVQAIREAHGNRLRSIEQGKSEASGMYWVKVRSTKKTNWKWERRCRIPNERRV